MRKIIGLFVLSLMVAACSTAQETKEEGKEESQHATSSDNAVVTLVGADKFKELMQNEEAQIVDVRTPEEYAQGKIGDAVNMNFFDADFKDQISGLDKSKPVLIYCAAGGRSAKAVAMMKSMGFAEIHELQGGYNAWK